MNVRVQMDTGEVLVQQVSFLETGIRRVNLCILYIAIIRFLGVCTANPCQNGGTCANSGTSPYYQCTCANGYSGSTCTTSKFSSKTLFTFFTCLFYFAMIAFLGVCTTNPCQNSGTCTVNSATNPYYQCTCANGYSGSTCTTSKFSWKHCSSFSLISFIQ